MGSRVVQSVWNPGGRGESVFAGEEYGEALEVVRFHFDNAGRVASPCLSLTLLASALDSVKLEGECLREPWPILQL
jgi:hypothetical protein